MVVIKQKMHRIRSLLHFTLHPNFTNYKLHTHACWLTLISGGCGVLRSTRVLHTNLKRPWVGSQVLGSSAKTSTLSNSPVLFLLSPGKMLLTMFLFQKWLVALFLKMSERGDSWCTDSSFSSLLVKLSQVFESTLLDSILKLVVISVACAHFPIQFLPPSHLCI